MRSDGDIHQLREMQTCGGKYVSCLELEQPARWKGSRNHCRDWECLRAQGMMLKQDTIFPSNGERCSNGTFRWARMLDQLNNALYPIRGQRHLTPDRVHYRSQMKKMRGWDQMAFLEIDQEAMMVKRTQDEIPVPGRLV